MKIDWTDYNTIITIKETTLTDKHSKVFDVRMMHNGETQVFHAVTERDAVALAEKLKDAIKAHCNGRVIVA